MPKRLTDQDILDRIIRGESEDDCWELDGTHVRSGYATVTRDQKRYVAHRFIYQMLVGPVAEDKVLDHLCRNRGCVNPAHLEPVSQSENMLRGSQGWDMRGWRCKRGHDLTRPGALHAPPSGGNRCGVCARERKQEANRLVTQAVSALGLPRSEYVKKYGTGTRAAKAVLNLGEG